NQCTAERTGGARRSRGSLWARRARRPRGAARSRRAGCAGGSRRTARSADAAWSRGARRTHWPGRSRWANGPRRAGLPGDALRTARSRRTLRSLGTLGSNGSRNEVARNDRSDLHPSGDGTEREVAGTGGNSAEIHQRGSVGRRSRPVVKERGGRLGFLGRPSAKLTRLLREGGAEAQGHRLGLGWNPAAGRLPAL